MRKYEDKPVEEIQFVRYKIVVPTEEDKLELEEIGELLGFPRFVQLVFTTATTAA